MAKRILVPIDAHEGSEAIEVAVGSCPVEQLLRRRDSQVVRHVDDVYDERAVDSRVADAQIEVAERRRVGGCQRRRG